MKKWVCSFLFGFILFSPGLSDGARIKDLSELQGVRDNQLIGYGLVVGLNDTGDSSSMKITMDSVANLLENLGMTVDRKAIKVKNVATVVVTAILPPFAKVGTKIDVLISSLGDAESLAGGTLLLTPLLGPDQNVYALAQGPVIVGGFSTSGQAAQVEKNHPTVGRIPDGGIVEQEIHFVLPPEGKFVYNLREADFTTMSRMVEVINSEFKQEIAQAKDSRSLVVSLPSTYHARPVQFLSHLETLQVEIDSKAKIVINERTGTIVIGDHVRISKVAVAHGNIKLTIKESSFVSQPAPFSERGQTVVIPDTEVELQEDNSRFVVMENGVSVGDLATALNAIGVTPRDVIAIFQAIKAAGAMQAELVLL
ncbi:MAG: flagellar basal body P-ring protein FlgI [Desulfobacterales bacterium]